MKTKKLSAKLVLNKETVASLENREMNSAMGGLTVETACEFTICIVCKPTIKPVICDPYRTVEFNTCINC